MSDILVEYVVGKVYFDVGYFVVFTKVCGLVIVIVAPIKSLVNLLAGLFTPASTAIILAVKSNSDV